MKLFCASIFIACSSLTLAAPLQLDVLPTVLRHRSPSIPSALQSASAEVDLLVEINEDGRVINAAVKRATDPRLAIPCLRVIRKWRYEPAQIDGAPVPATFVQPFRFGVDDTAMSPLESVPPTARHRVSPIIPDGLEHTQAEVTVAFNLSATGEVEDVQVVSSTHASLEDATVDAALRWTFKPAIQEGFPVPSRVLVPFHYLGDRQEGPRFGPIVPVAKRGSRTREH